jgi:hypothetical protein
MHKVSGALGGTALCILGQIQLWLVHWLGFAQGCAHPLCAQSDWEENRICELVENPVGRFSYVARIPLNGSNLN